MNSRIEKFKHFNYTWQRFMAIPTSRQDRSMLFWIFHYMVTNGHLIYHEYLLPLKKYYDIK